MSDGEFCYVLGVGLPIFIVLAILSLMVLFVQAYQFAKQEQRKVAKRITIGGLSFALSILATVGISFFTGIYVAASLIVLWFILAAATGSVGLQDYWAISMVVSAVPVILIIVVIGMVLGIWPLSALSIQGYKIAKQKQSLGAKVGTVVFAIFGAVCCVSSILTAALITTSIALGVSGKRLGLS